MPEDFESDLHRVIGDLASSGQRRSGGLEAAQELAAHRTTRNRMVGAAVALGLVLVAGIGIGQLGADSDENVSVIDGATPTAVPTSEPEPSPISRAPLSEGDSGDQADPDDEGQVVPTATPTLAAEVLAVIATPEEPNPEPLADPVPTSEVPTSEVSTSEVSTADAATAEADADAAPSTGGGSGSPAPAPSGSQASATPTPAVVIYTPVPATPTPPTPVPATPSASVPPPPTSAPATPLPTPAPAPTSTPVPAPTATPPTATPVPPTPTPVPPTVTPVPPTATAVPPTPAGSTGCGPGETPVDAGGVNGCCPVGGVVFVGQSGFTECVEIGTPATQTPAESS